MNVAVKSLNNISVLPRFITHPLEAINLTWIIIFASLIIFSALGVVCIQSMNRQLTNKLQTLQVENFDLHNIRSQLLLEKSTLASATRIQTIAQKQLAMVIPKIHTIILE